MKETKLSVENVSYSYGQNPVLQDVAFSIPKGTLVSVLGPNGSGKSTLVKNIAGVLKGNEDLIFLDGEPQSSFQKREYAKEVSYAGQQFMFNMPIDVYDAVMLGRRPYQRFFINKEDKKLVWSVLELFQLTHLSEKLVTELSGGQQQKVHIASAMAQDTDLVLLDEPTNNLDVYHQLDIMNILRDIVDERGITMLVVAHDLNLASRFSDILMMMKDGKCEIMGKPEEVISSENLEYIYDVETDIIENRGNKQVIPISCIHRHDS